MKKFQQTREIINYVQKYISGRILDLGAGSAKYQEIIKQKATEYIAFDMVPGKNINVVGDVLNLSFQDKSFKTVISTQVLEHVEKPWVMIKEIHRVLKSGGICILTAPFLTPYHPDPNDYFRFTVEGIKSLFKNEGFEIIECEGYGKTFSVLSEFIRFSCFNPYQKRRKGSWLIANFIAKIAKFLDRFTKNEMIYDQVYIVAKKKN